jgi:drug/metabolite transporter (DMT)-like permease
VERTHAALTARDTAALVVINLIWGSSYVVTKGALAAMPALPLACARFGLAWLVFALLALVRAGSSRKSFNTETPRHGEGLTSPPDPRGAAAEGGGLGRGSLFPRQPDRSEADRWETRHPSPFRGGAGGEVNSSMVNLFGPAGGARIALVGLVGFCLDYVFFYRGLALTTASDAAILVNMEAIFTAVLGAALLGERLGGRALLGIVTACAGAALLLRPAEGGAAAVASAGSRAWGNGLILIALVCEALATVLSRPLRRRWAPLALTRRLVGWGALGLLPLALLEVRSAPDPAAWLTPVSLGGIAYLALGCTVFCYSIWYGLLGRIEAGRAAAFLYVQPLIGVLLGITLQGDRLDLPAIAGAALIAAGIAATSRSAT